MTTAAAVDDDPGLLCPGCGFDLRGTDSARCGECGLAIDRAALEVSGIPWAHRRAIGRVRAYFKTFWGVQQDREEFRYEAAKPQGMADGRAFARVTGFILAVALVGVFAVIVWRGKGLGVLAVQDDDWLVLPNGRFRWLPDVVIPWSAGATFWPVLPACLTVLGFYLAGVQRFVARATVRPERAVAMLSYASAPLALVPIGLAAVGVGAMLREKGSSYTVNPLPEMSNLLVGSGNLIIAIALLQTPVRIGQWVMRTRHCGIARAALAVAEWLGLCLLGSVVLLALVPWCVGFLWIAFDSLR